MSRIAGRAVLASMQAVKSSMELMEQVGTLRPRRWVAAGVQQIRHGVVLSERRWLF